MIHAQDRSLIGHGVVGTKPFQSRRGFGEVGNSNELKLAHATEEKALPNYRTGVGNNNSVTRITAVTGSFTLYDVTPPNLALLLNAKVKGVAAGAVAGEVHPTAGEAGEHVVFANLVDTSADATVKALPATGDAIATEGNGGDGTLNNGTDGKVSTSGVAAGTYTVTLSSASAFTVTKSGGTVIGSGTVGEEFSAGGFNFTVTAGTTQFIADDTFTITVAAGTEVEAGIDYLLTSYGLQITANSRIGASGISVDYARVEASVVEVFKAASVEQTMHFAGLNDAQNGEPYDATLHRVKFKTIAELSLSSTEYVGLAVTFECMQDYTRTGDELSQFYTLRQVNKAA
ncbi:hypothetical protein SAMN05216201_11173 [Pseudomonas linyingensis]|uniref:Uncharacterized protein n=1 Tax=Pseudomonas linyingensis TaxID=915471 RepID=A0A1H6ZZA2_9PSED|nr:hypothetical protein [Pseudomonas linyingensis]SEJ57976.1 hypothetical protein SAMN05216201_11173 [Pseudomonas linyingensis]